MATVKRLEKIGRHHCLGCGRFPEDTADGSCEFCGEFHREPRHYRALKDETYKWQSNTSPTGVTGHTKLGIEGVDK